VRLPPLCSQFLAHRVGRGERHEWALRADGTSDDENRGRRRDFDQPISGSHFVAKVMAGIDNSKWRVALIRPFEVVVVTADVDPEYRYPIHCMRDGSMVWPLTCAPEIDETRPASRLGFQSRG
jgi:apolipoprotein D and lipocalin family protein